MSSSYAEDTIECTPTGLAKGAAGCFMFLLSVIAVASLGVIAGGTFWTAQAMYAITDGNPGKFFKVQLLQPITVSK